MDRRGLTTEQKEGLIDILKNRFEANMERHRNIKWSAVASRLESLPKKMWSLYEMERTEGEPDVVDQGLESGEFIFYDCSPESPKGRRSLCYDSQALESRKEHKPNGSVVEMAEQMGIELLSEQEYRELQNLGIFDSKTSSWIKTPEDIRAKGGALFCDYRFGHVFVYHNGAESYYAARGFRGLLKV